MIKTHSHSEILITDFPVAHSFVIFVPISTSLVTTMLGHTCTRGSCLPPHCPVNSLISTFSVMWLRLSGRRLLGRGRGGLVRLLLVDRSRAAEYFRLLQLTGDLVDRILDSPG